MTENKFQGMSSKRLVERFAAIAIQQDEAMLRDETAKYNKLFSEMNEVEGALKSRPGDHRRLLMSLYDHPNAQVRLKAAIRTLGIAPDAARALLEAIANSKKYPQAGDAGMTLVNLDRGIFKPT